MDFIALILEHLDALIAVACGVFVLYRAALFMDAKLPARESEQERRHVDYYFD